MIEQGVLVIIPVMPDPPVPEVRVKDKDKPNVAPTSSSNINDGKQRRSRKWLPNLWPFGKPGEGVVNLLGESCGVEGLFFVI